MTRALVVVLSGEEVVTLHVSTEATQAVARHSYRALFVRWLGPACALGGFVWALAQPYRITLLHPHGQGFWWLLSEPPLYVVLVGLAFHWLVAPGVLEDLEDAEMRGGGSP
jgi:hypothetical protein